MPIRILSILRKENIDTNNLNIRDVFIHYLNINASNYIESARYWFDSKLREIDKESDKTDSGKETNKSGKKARIKELEQKYFKITLKEYKDNGYKIINKKNS